VASVRGVLVDTGPLVAITDSSDAFHERCVDVLRELRDPLFTVWPVITEAMHLVGSHVAQERLWDVLEDGALRLRPLDMADVPRMKTLMKKYRDLPMNFADAALVRVAERDQLHTVLTTDRSDFSVYRLHGSRRFRLLL
jgi:predicted nucleic acid-binding protein